MRYLVVIRFVILASFIGLSVGKFGLQRSYSAYAKLWKEFLPIHNVNIWSAVTIVVAIMQLIPMLTTLEGSALQFVSFLTPCYLIAVACTPNYQSNKSQKIAHYIFTICCAVGFLIYVCAGLHLWWVPVTVYGGFVLLLALPTKTPVSSLILWIECALFSTAHIVELIPGA